MSNIIRKAVECKAPRVELFLMTFCLQLLALAEIERINSEQTSTMHLKFIELDMLRKYPRYSQTNFIENIFHSERDKNIYKKKIISYASLKNETREREREKKKTLHSDTFRELNLSHAPRFY